MRILKLNRRVRGWWNLAGMAFSHPSNKGHRLQTLKNILRYEIASLLKRSIEIDFGQRSRVHVSKSGDSSSRVAFARIPDWPEMVVWKLFLDEKAVFLDVGANIGLYSVIAAETGAKVKAFEPSPVTAEKLRSNIRLNNLRNIDVIQKALMNVPGIYHLEGVDLNRNRVFSIASPGETIEGDILDAYVESGSKIGIKIDVEGNERLVLEGGEQTLRTNSVQLIQLEWNDLSLEALSESRVPVQDILKQCGYFLYRFDEKEKFVALDLEGAIPFGRDVFAVTDELKSWFEDLRFHALLTKG